MQHVQITVLPVVVLQAKRELSFTSYMMVVVVVN
jgi:hypothetical protein